MSPTRRFQTDVLERSDSVPVVVDLWAPWCGPCKTLGPMLEKAVADTGGAVELAKVNVDENPRVAAQFQVQSIPAVFAINDGKVVDQFIGALPEAQVTAFVAAAGPGPERGGHARRRGRRGLAAQGARARARPRRRHRGAGPHPDRPRGRAGGAGAPAAPARDRGRPRARRRGAPPRGGGGRRRRPTAREIEAKLDELLERVRDDDGARQEFVDLLEAMGADDPRTNEYRRALAARLF